MKSLVINALILVSLASGCGPESTLFPSRRSSPGDGDPSNGAPQSPNFFKPNSDNRAMRRLSSFRPGEVWLDTSGKPINAHGGGFYFEGGTYYWFGEHKGKDGLARDGVHLYSSQDLYNWTDEGFALSIDKTNPNSDIAEGAILERPKVIYNAKTKKYVMWFHLELKGQGYGSARAGVAVSDKVRGPYQFVESFRPNREMSRDQTLFVDDDGKAYQFAASEENQTMRVNELSDDYLKTSGRSTRIFIGRSWEAPAVFKHKGRYHIIGSACTGWDPNAARQAVADNVMGPWTELNNPATGADADVTFYSQSTYILEVGQGSGNFIYIGDRWKPDNLEDSRYIWLPLEQKGDEFTMRWRKEWSLADFAK